MKYITLIISSFLLLSSCNNESATEKELYVPKQADYSMYIGKFMYSDSAVKVISSLPYHKGSSIYMMVGCECGDEVGEHNNTKESTTKDSSIVEAVIGGDLLEYVKSLDKNLLEHLYFGYLYTNPGDNRTAKTGAVVMLAFFDFEDNTPLEKLTRYTMGKSTSIITVGKNAPNKAPDVDSNRVKVPVIIKNKDTLPLPPLKNTVGTVVQKKDTIPVKKKS